MFILINFQNEKLVNFSSKNFHFIHIVGENFNIFKIKIFIHIRGMFEI